MTDDKNKGGDEIEFISEAPPPGESEGGESPHSPPKSPGEKAPSEAGKHLKEKLKKRDDEIKHLRKELGELKEAHLRRLADMENLRKRFEREKAEFQQYALSDLLLELLVIGDNFERALQSVPPGEDGKTYREGVELISRMLRSLLAKHGVRPIELESRAFDPNFHQAMVVEESVEFDEPTIEEELQKGYMIHDRLLRPTLVKVLVPKKGQ
jgi:molecular chaperone GrpE